MKVVIVTLGTLGDALPFVALGVGLRRAGHDVTVATHTDFEALVTGHGLSFRPVGGSFKQIMESEAGRDWLESGDSLFRYKTTLERAFAPTIVPWLEETYAVALEADVVLYHPTACGAYYAAEKNGVPAMMVSAVPTALSGELDPLMAPNAPRWRWLRVWLSEFSMKTIWSLSLDAHNAHRTRVGLDAFRTKNPWQEILLRGVPVLNLYSESLLPSPNDWPSHVHTPGFCFLDRDTDWQPPSDLVDFIAGGSTPIYVGFGSMTGRDPQQLARLTIDATSRAKQRVVLVSGWGGIDTSAADVPDHVYLAKSVPHDWLFPRVSAVVHHGGAGTTAAGLRAGRPTLVTAFFGDQPFWGKQVARAGAGPVPLHRRKLDAGVLADAITRTLSESSYRERAEGIAEQMGREDGVAKAVKIVEQYAVV